MNNVPSSALLAIVAVICAVMTGMIVFLVVNSGVLSGNNANKTALGLTGKAAEEIYTDYDGQQVTGRHVLAAIEKMKGQSVSVAVVDGSGVMTQFFYDYHGEGSSEPLTSLEDQYSSMIKQAKTKGSASYIPPSAFYFGHVITDSKSGAIYQIRFEVQVSDSATGSSDSSSAYEGNHQDLGH